MNPDTFGAHLIDRLTLVAVTAIYIGIVIVERRASRESRRKARMWAVVERVNWRP